MSSISFSSLTGGTDYSTLFSSLSNNNKSNGSSGIMNASLYSDFASIKNGSYAKLCKAYYSEDSGKSSKSSQALDAATKNTLGLKNSSLKSDATGLSSAVKALDDKGLYENKIKTKDADGNETENFDYDKILSNVKSFVEGYNSMIESGGASDNSSVLSNTLSMVQNTNANINTLSKIGISVGYDNKLSVDEDALKKADMSAFKTLFTGTNSYGDKIESNANAIERIAQNSMTNQLGYNSSGSFNGLSGSLYDSFY